MDETTLIVLEAVVTKRNNYVYKSGEWLSRKLNVSPSSSSLKAKFKTLVQLCKLWIPFNISTLQCSVETGRYDFMWVMSLEVKTQGDVCYFIKSYGP